MVMRLGLVKDLVVLWVMVTPWDLVKDSHWRPLIFRTLLHRRQAISERYPIKAGSL